MKIKILFLFFMILISCGSSNQKNPSPLFRHVNLYTYGKFELGEDLKKVDSLTEQINNRFFLKKKVFGGAESIELIPDSKGRIYSIIFNYGNKTTLESEIKDYKKSLGIPKLNNSIAIWNDGNTSFELYQENGNILSKMTDLKN